MRPIIPALALALPLAALHAQTAVPYSGDRVRIHVTDPRMSWVFTGTLVFQDADSLTLVEQLKDGRVVDPSGAVGTAERRISVARSQVTRMEVSTGLHSTVGRGALIGAGAGAVAGLSTIAIVCASSDYECDASTGQVVAGTAYYAVAGAAAGAIGGLFRRHEKWVAAGEGPRASVLLRPSEEGTALGFAIRFCYWTGRRLSSARDGRKRYALTGT